MARVSNTVREYLQQVLPPGVDPGVVDEMARKVARSPAPAATLDAELAVFGKRFQVGCPQTFAVAAAATGDEALAPLGKAIEAHQAAVQGLRDAIAKVEAEGHAIEAANQGKAAEVAQLVQSIASRKSDLESAQEKKGRIGMAALILGIPAVAKVSAVQMVMDDVRIKELNGQLATAREAQRDAETRLAAHAARKATLTTKLAALQQKEVELVQGLATAPARPVGGHLGAAQAAATLKRREALQANLRSQLELLEAVRDSAAAVGVHLDGAIRDLRAQLAAADKLVEASQKDLLQLVKVITADDPAAAATRWLDQQVAAKTKALMRELGLDVNVYISRLVKEAYPANTPEAELLRRELTKALQAGLRPPG
ncbi:MAG: hypothetical protein KC933_03020 [Myxococcales bacterium]|nr:hypothetical protein [Myxococcales bacterium]